MKTTRVVIVDLDEVVISMMPQWLRIYRERSGITLDYGEFKDWNCSHIPQSQRKVWHECLEDLHLYDKAEAIKGAAEGVGFLRNMGYRVVFATSCFHGQADQKLYWLQRWGFLPRRLAGDPELDYAALSDKSLLRGDIIIDDKPRSCFQFPGKALLFTTQQNAAIEDLPLHVTRAPSWEQIPSLVLQLVP